MGAKNKYAWFCPNLFLRCPFLQLSHPLQDLVRVVAVGQTDHVAPGRSGVAALHSDQKNASVVDFLEAKLIPDPEIKDETSRALDAGEYSRNALIFFGNVDVKGTSATLYPLISGVFFVFLFTVFLNTFRLLDCLVTGVIFVVFVIFVFFTVFCVLSFCQSSDFYKFSMKDNIFILFTSFDDRLNRQRGGFGWFDLKI